MFPFLSTIFCSQSPERGLCKPQHVTSNKIRVNSLSTGASLALCLNIATRFDHFQDRFVSLDSGVGHFLILLSHGQLFTTPAFLGLHNPWLSMTVMEYVPYVS